MAARLHLIINAAVVEELFFRGFLIERLVALTGRPWLAGGISCVLFVASHLSDSGLVHTFTIVAVGAVGVVFLHVKRRNVFACILMHAIGNSPLLLAS